MILDRRSQRLLGLVGGLLLFLPKISLYRSGYQSAGIRIDDLVLLMLGLLFTAEIWMSRRSLATVERIILLFFSAGILSSFIGIISYLMGGSSMQPNPLYSCRIIEYFVFFWAGRALCPHLSLGRLLGLLVVAHVSFMALQAAGMVGGFGTRGYQVSYRVMGLTAHATELGLVLNIVAAALLMKVRVLYLIPLGIALLGAQLLGGNRIALLGAGAVIGGICWERRGRLSLISLAGAAVVLTVILLAGGSIISHTELGRRSQRLLSPTNLEMAQRVYQRIDIERETLAEASVCSLNDQVGYDMSWWMRLHKWSYMLKLYLSRPSLWLMGGGPGVAGVALDGGWLRLLVENGLVGIGLFGLFIWRLGKISPIVKWGVVALAINMIFIDSYLSYKPMSLLLFIGGYEHERNHHSTDLHNSRRLRHVRSDLPALAQTGDESRTASTT